MRREGFDDDADYDDREAKEKGSERGGEGVVASCFSLPCWPVLSLELSQHKIFSNPSSFCRSVLIFLSFYLSLSLASHVLFVAVFSTHRYSSGQYLETLKYLS